ncbi:hypothetical protein BDR26DRAFT_863321 [Obelidium mucronatum]|nr:hypothetical protein BDR26DRAFT_863321 [Obelidium mucronatum]
MELPTVGKHCACEGCNTLDFLPFKCPNCALTFCRDHRLHHNCANSVDRIVSIEDLYNPNAKSEKIPCSLEGCLTIEKIVSLCAGCGKQYCLAHRHGVDHNCVDIARQAASAQEKKTGIQNLVNSKLGLPLTATTSKKEVLGIPKKKVNYKIELMKMKQNAKGDASIPTESRIYFRVHFPQESSMESQPLYFHKDWPVGKLLDKIAVIGKVSNLNNTGEEDKKLALYNAETDAILPMNSPLSSLIDSGILQNAGSILLERVCNKL